MSLVLSALNSNAMIVGSRQCLDNDSIEDSMLCTMLTMSSLPTMIIDGQAVDLNTQEADARLIVEAYGNADRVLIAKLASELQVPQEKIVSVVISQGEAATVKSVIEAL